MIDCIEHNAALPFVDAVTLLDQDSGVRWQSSKIRAIPTATRASYGDLLATDSSTRKNGATHLAITNSDIYLSHDVERLLQRINKQSTVTAITRREHNGQLYKQPKYSQDTWIFKTHPISNDVIKACDVELGIAGCEHLFAMALHCHGYSIWNPCLDCIIKHNDPTPHSQYNKRLYGAYLWLPPCRIDNVENVAPAYEVRLSKKSFPSQG